MQQLQMFQQCIFALPLKNEKKLPSKFLNVYDFGMKMYTSKTIIALMVRKDEMSLAEKFIFSGQIHKHSETLTVHLESQRALNLFYAELKT